ncbi:MAG: transglutaminase-like domain-containing protein [Oscillospiraceae bacterium]|nr:transglutaminase-like domain-containing protein [Oscillospiraceae bacterium]
MLKILFFYTAAILMLAGCSSREVSPEPPPVQIEQPVITDQQPKNPPVQDQPQALDLDDQPPKEQAPTYIEILTQEVIAKFAHPDMGEYEKAKAAFDFMIENTGLTEPVGLELWRVRGENDPQPSFEENRSLSVFLYGIGMCEDYAAALTVLLRGMGMEARYVPGLTYAADGSGLVDHAWTAAKIDGVWYHLDCQLEDNITRRDTIRYKYFMKSDAFMSASHRWGQNLIDTGLLTSEQNEEIAREFLLEPCPQDAPLPPPGIISSAPMPDKDAILAEIDKEIAAYEEAHGKLPQLELKIIPPVFGGKGYPG